MSYQFRRINLERDLETCIAFRRDSYTLSFGSLDGFESDMLNYESRMRAREQDVPEGNCHLWLAGRIVGQTEMKLVDDPDVGYVSLFYLAKEFRSQGLGNLLHDRAVETFAALDKSTLWLSVSRTNQHANRFYEKQGWTSRGPRPGKESVERMSFAL